MFSVSNLKTSRPMRLVVALFISLTFFYSFYYAGWNPRHMSPILKTSVTTATSDTGSIAHDPSKDHLTSDPGSYPSNINTSIRNIPDKVWHSAKTDQISKQQREWVSSWTVTNPSFRQELLTDRSGEEFVRAHYQETRPDIVEIYESLPIPILRADLLRYLIVLAEGGYWSDLDVSSETSAADWVPGEYKHQNIDMIVGLEFDFEWRGPDTEVASQFCNWVFSAQPLSQSTSDR